MRHLFTVLVVLFVFNAFAQDRSIYTQTVSPRGTYIAISKDKLIGVYKLTDNVPVFSVAMNENIVGAGFSDDETQFIIQDEKFSFRSFDLSNEGEEQWASDAGEALEIPYEIKEIEIVQSQSGDYLLVMHQMQAIFLDRNTGELVGYAELETYMRDFGLRKPTIYTTGENSFEIGHQNVEGYCITSLEILGYGQVKQRRISYENDSEFGYPMLAHYPEKTIFYTHPKLLKYESTINGKSFIVGKGERTDAYDGFFSRDGKYMILENISARKLVYHYDSRSKVSQMSTEQRPIFINQEVVVTIGYNADYSVFQTATGTRLYEANREDDLKYKGTSVSKGRWLKGAGVVFFDDFDDNYQEWSTKVTDKISGKISGGNYVLKSNKGAYGRWNNKIALDPFRDFEIEVKLKSIPDKEQGEFGIFWGRHGKHGYKSDFRMRNSGEYYIGKYQRGKWYASKGWTSSDHIQRNDFNTFKVRKEGNTYTYFLNDEQVHQEPFYGLLGSKVGFNYVKGTMWVDYIKVSYLNDNKQSSAPIYTMEFDEDTDKWAAGTEEGKYDQRVEDGHYRYEVMASSAYSKWHNRFYIDENQDYELEIAVKFVETNSTHLLGIMWGKESDGWNRYQFGISPKGSFRIDHRNNGKPSPMRDWKRHDAIKPDEYNELKIKKIGEQYKFYINNQLVAIEKGFLSHGPVVGITVPHETVAHIDYIRARYINTKSGPYRDYWYRSGKRIFIPYMRPNNPANLGKKVLIGDPIFCENPPKKESGGLGFATTTTKVQWDYWIVDDEDEIEYGKQKLKDIYPGGWLVWDHNIKCK